MEDIDKVKRTAATKHRKKLKRKYKKYNPDFWRAVEVSRKRTLSRVISAPLNFSIIKNTDEVIRFFDAVRIAQVNREFVRLDTSEVTYTDLATITMLMAHMYDESLPWGYLTVTGPKNEQPKELFRKVQFDETVRSRDSDSAHFLRRGGLDNNKNYKEAILERTQAFFGGKKDTHLNPILTEIISNTNNHASSTEKVKVPWLITMEEDDIDKTIKYCVIDLGIGIYESLTRQGNYIRKAPFGVQWLEAFFKNSQYETLANNIPDGLLSSTNLDYRGQGMQNIYSLANLGSFKEFSIITNSAQVNLLDLSENGSDSLYNFRGTLYYWTLQNAA